MIDQPQDDLQFHCPRCNTRIVVHPAKAGERVDCPMCGHQLAVPGVPQRKARCSELDSILDPPPHVTKPESVQAGASAATTRPVDDPADPLFLFREEGQEDNSGENVEQNVKRGEDADSDPAANGGVELVDDDEASAEFEDDFGELLPITLEREPRPDPATAPADPFALDPEKPLNIEGISPPQNTFSVKCPICFTVIHASPSQIGTEKKCPDCYSPIPITEAAMPPKLAKPTAGKKPADDDSGEYPLSPAGDLRTGNTATSVPSDRDILFLDEHPVTPARGEEPLGLPSSDRDLLAPLPSQAETDIPITVQPENESAAFPGFSFRQRPARDRAPAPSVAPEHAAAAKRSPVADSTDPATSQPPAKTSLYSEPADDDLKSIQEGLGDWARHLLSVLADVNVTIRIVLMGIVLGFAYWMFDLGWGVVSQDIPPNEKFIGFFWYFVGFWAFIGVTVPTLVFVSTVIRAAAYRQQQIDEWPELFDLAEVGSELMNIGVSLFVGAFPGAFVGTMYWISTGSFGGFFVLLLLSAMTLSPIALISAFYNGSPFQVVSPEVLSTFGSQKLRWARFYLGTAAIFALLMIGKGLLFVSLNIVSVLFAFVIAGFEIALAMVYGKMLGLHMGQIGSLLARRQQA